jgi:hypothetical protein
MVSMVTPSEEKDLGAFYHAHLESFLNFHLDIHSAMLDICGQFGLSMPQAFCDIIDKDATPKLGPVDPGNRLEKVLLNITARLERIEKKLDIEPGS